MSVTVLFVLLKNEDNYEIKRLKYAWTVKIAYLCDQLFIIMVVSHIQYNWYGW